MGEMVFGIVVIAVAIIAMAHVLFSRMSPKRKAFWFVIVAVVPVFGAVVYFVVKPQDN